MATTDIHEEKNTFSVDVFLPGHEARTTTPLFTRTRKALLARDNGRCYICNCTAEDSGHPIEAHHYPIERSFAEMIDWSIGSIIRKEFYNFDWLDFHESDPYYFVDNMLYNGRLLCKAHHIGKDEGVHCLPEPVWLAQRYGKDGYKFSDVEIIHHGGLAT